MATIIDRLQLQLLMQLPKDAFVFVRGHYKSKKRRVG
jgi:hypothetical protein